MTIRFSALMNRITLLALLLCCSLTPVRAQTIESLVQSWHDGEPTGIAVDSHGNAFVADGLSRLITELPAGNPAAPITLGVGVNAGWALAVDAGGNVFAAANSEVYEIPSGFASNRKLAGGFQYPFGIALDGSGNLFVSDYSANTVNVILAVDGAIPDSPQIVTIGSGFDHPAGLALDAQGNVYVADTGSNSVKRILVAGGYATVETLAGGLASPQGLALDAAGNIYVGDSGDGTIREILAAGGYNTVETLASGQDILLFCVSVDAAGDVFFTNGSGVQELPVGGTLQPVGNFIGAVGLAFDRSGDLFVGDLTAGSVTELTAASHFTNAISVTASVNTPLAVAADAQDNLYVIDTSGSVKKMLAATGYTQVYAYGRGFSTESYGIALDTSGNIYVSDSVDHAVTELTAADGYGTARVLSSDFTRPEGIAVDAAGNVFVADPGAAAVKEILAVDGSIPAQPVIQILGSGFVGPTGIALDSSDDLYVADSSAGALREFFAAGGYTQSITLPGDANGPFAVARDSQGDLFVTEIRFSPPQAHQPPPLGGVYEILAGPPVLYAAILPGSRAVQLGTTATVFATLINSGPTDFADCFLSTMPSVTAPGLSFAYQTTDPVTNTPTGTQNTPVPIPGNGGSQSFLLSFSSYLSQPFTESGLQLSFGCSQGPNPTTISYAAIVPGVDTVDLSMSATPVPDIIALAATPTGNGVVEIPSGGSAAFAVASLNLGSTAPITVSVDTGGAVLPVTATLCETDPATSQCLATPTAALTLDFAADAAPTFSVFAQANSAMPFAPATSRLFVRFEDASGGTHGSTSVAVDTK